MLIVDVDKEREEITIGGTLVEIIFEHSPSIESNFCPKLEGLKK